jgi:hypothetical protein
MRTYTRFVKLNLLIDEKIVSRARSMAAALSKSLNRIIGKDPQALVGRRYTERSIEEFERLSSQGFSHGWRFSRDELHQRS